MSLWLLCTQFLDCSSDITITLLDTDKPIHSRTLSVSPCVLKFTFCQFGICPVWSFDWWLHSYIKIVGPFIMLVLKVLQCAYQTVDHHLRFVVSESRPFIF